MKRRERRFRATRSANVPPRAFSRQRDVGEIQLGTVGWQDGKHYDLEDEGVPLVKVTLFAGHNTDTQGERQDPARASGMQVLAQFDGRGSDLPEDGEIVIVARPANMAEAQGAYYIIGRPMPHPKWIPNVKSGERILYGPRNSFIRFKDDGTIFVCAFDGQGDDAKPIYLSVGKDGWEVRHPYGKARADKYGFEMSHSSGAAISGGALGGLPAPFSALSSFLNLRAATVNIEAAAVSLGAGFNDNVLKATPTLSVLTNMQAAIVAIQATLLAIQSAGAAAPTISALNTAMAAIATASLATSGTAVTASGATLATAAVTAPTQSLSAG